jgi:hypothetical protein
MISNLCDFIHISTTSSKQISAGALPLYGSIPYGKCRSFSCFTVISKHTYFADRAIRNWAKKGGSDGQCGIDGVETMKQIALKRALYVSGTTSNNRAVVASLSLSR